MTLEQMHRLAHPHTSQTQLIRGIQIRHGKAPCFASEKRYTCDEPCEWSRECRKLRAHWIA